MRRTYMKVLHYNQYFDLLNDDLYDVMAFQFIASGLATNTDDAIAKMRELSNTFPLYHILEEVVINFNDITVIERAPTECKISLIDGRYFLWQYDYIASVDVYGHKRRVHREFTDYLKSRIRPGWRGGDTKYRFPPTEVMALGLQPHEREVHKRSKENKRQLGMQTI